MEVMNVMCACINWGYGAIFGITLWSLIDIRIVSLIYSMITSASLNLFELGSL